MFRSPSLPLVRVLSCACAAALAIHGYVESPHSSGNTQDPKGIEDIPQLFPVVVPFVVFTWHEGEKPSPAEVSVYSSRAGYEEIRFSAAPSVSWLHVTPEAATTPAKLAVWIDPAIPDTAGEIVISDPAAKWQRVYIRVNTRVATRVAAELAAAVNGASSSAGIAPGGVVTLFGSHLGPADSVAAELVDGAYQTEVARTSFKLDGTPCPILYVSGGQSNIIIPWTIQPGKRTLEVTNVYAGNTYEGAGSLDVAPAAPGIFTRLMNGRGPAVAMNEDYSLNTAANPAKRGSYIMLYATGLGDLEERPLRDGAVENRVLRHKTIPTARVGTKPAFVNYAGSAPGFVSAVSQVNVQIPLDAPSGEVELMIATGTKSSQDGVTIFVR